jgi:hypothetical protein
MAESSALSCQYKKRLYPVMQREARAAAVRQAVLLAGVSARHASAAHE